MKQHITLLLIFVAQSIAINDVIKYIDFIGKIALNESIIAEQSDFLDRRERLFEEKMGAYGNDYLGASHFKCPTMGARSPSTPLNVNAVRLNDLGAMGAMGDGFTTGFGAGAHSLLELPLDYRGLSFTIGGDSDLIYSTTLPNLINQFSANVVGASTRVAPVWFEYFSNFNVAMSGAKSSNMTEQAIELIRRMKTSEHFNSDNEYKLITIFVGANDLCHSCKDTAQHTAEQYKANLKMAIDKLRDNLPKTIVSVISPAHVELIQMMSKASSYCKNIHKEFCPCLSADNTHFIELVKAYQMATHELADTYDDKDDFAVIVQTFLEKQELPYDNDGQPDFSFFAPDCSHFSHWAHSLLAKGLFNNMLEPVAEKATKYDLSTLEPKCPDAACPFIRTRGNARTDQCGQLAKKTPALIAGPVSFKKNVPQDTVLAADTTAKPKTDNNLPYIPVVIKDTGGNTALVLIGLTLGLIFGLIIGAVTWHILTIKRGDQLIYVNEKTPLLKSRDPNYNSQDNQYVQIY